MLDTMSPTQIGSRWRALSPDRKLAGIILGILTASVAIYLSTMLSERLLVPAWLEPLTHAIYRIGYFARLPMIVLLSPFFPMEGHHHTQPRLQEFVTSFTAIWFWFLLASPLVIARLLARKFARHAPNATKQNLVIPRRAFLAGVASSIGVPGALGAYAVLLEPQRVRLERYKMHIKELPESLNGFRIVHVSDTHYGPFISLPYIRAVIAQANELQGDLVVLTGDYVHRTPRAIPDGVAVLKSFRSRLGTLATLGNHDHWEGAAEVRAAFAESGIPLIDNKRLFLSSRELNQEPNIGQSICIGGVGDLWEDVVDIERALEGAPESMPRLLLAHNPDTAEQVPPGMRIDLIFSGHTHGGQVWVPGLGTPILPSGYGQKYAGGLCAGPHCPVIVSRGIGMAIMPVRFGVRPEIGEITLVRA